MKHHIHPPLVERESLGNLGTKHRSMGCLGDLKTGDLTPIRLLKRPASWGTVDFGERAEPESWLCMGQHQCTVCPGASPRPGV
jgi:hypothetical protein